MSSLRGRSSAPATTFLSHLNCLRWLLGLVKDFMRALASSKFVTTGIQNSAAFLRIRYSSFRIVFVLALLLVLGILITSLMSLFMR